MTPVVASLADRYHPTIALLPIGGHFTMDPTGAALAAKLLKVKTVVPMHYGTFPMLAGTPEQLREALKKADDVDVRLRLYVILRLLSPGEVNPDGLRDARAVQVLEVVRTAAARKVLEALAKGVEEAPRTRLAKVALARLGEARP